jgi:hypothetical protein
VITDEIDEAEVLAVRQYRLAIGIGLLGENLDPQAYVLSVTPEGNVCLYRRGAIAYMDGV